MTKQAAPTPKPPKVIAIKPQPLAVQPPDDWKAHSSLGLYLRFDGTDAGRLARLGDVVRWLMQTRELPRATAVAAVCDALEAASPAPGLFFCEKTETAKPVPDVFAFGLHTAESLERAKDKYGEDTRQRGLEQRRASEWGSSGWLNRDGFGGSTRATNQRAAPSWPEPVLPGLPAAVQSMRTSWGKSTRDDAKVLDDIRGSSSLQRLAVRMADAAALWGYGAAAPAMGAAVVAPPGPDAVTTYDAVVKYRKDYKEREGVPAPWTVAQVDLIEAEITLRNGQTGVRNGIANDLGISVSRLNEKLRKQEKRPAAVARRTA